MPYRADPVPPPAKVTPASAAKSDLVAVLSSDLESTAMSRPLVSLIRRNPVSCRSDATVREVIHTMHGQGIGSMVVCDDAQAPVGIFTIQDVLDRVTLPGIDLSAPVSQVMTGNLKTLSVSASAYEAAFTMAGEGIHHVVVVDDCKLAGVVSERDLFARPGGFLRRLGAEVRHAEDRASLVRASRAIQELAANMLHQGLAPAQVTRLISTLNDVLTQQIIRLETRRVDFGGIQWCFIEMGSAGRLEQTFSTDQDNGIIFRQPADTTPEAVRERLLPVALQVNRMLADCGIPLCRGGVMASNPQCCLSLPEWQQRFADWIYHGNPPALLNTTIFFDFRAQFGDTALALELRRWLMSYAAGNHLFLAQMTQNALANQPPLGLIRDFVPTGGKAHPNAIDLKVNCITPFVDAARIYSLAAGVAATNTVQRLRESGQKLTIPETEVAAWVEALNFLQGLRLKHQDTLAASSQALHNFLPLDSLNELERQILKESLRQARKLQSRLARYMGLMELGN